MKEDKKTQTQKPKPNEAGTISVEAHLKIFDPNTEKVFVNKRS